MILRRYVNSPAFNIYNDWDPLDKWKKEMEKMTQQIMRGTDRRRAGVFPLINLTEDKENFYLRAELPGVKSEALDIEITGNTVSISGERKIPDENNDAKYHRRERESGKFSRMFSLSSDIDSENVDANLVNGILTVVLPKSEKAKPRQITVK